MILSKSKTLKENRSPDVRLDVLLLYPANTPFMKLVHGDSVLQWNASQMWLPGL
jgi:hypothetical protein